MSILFPFWRAISPSASRAAKLVGDRSFLSSIQPTVSFRQAPKNSHIQIRIMRQIPPPDFIFGKQGITQEDKNYQGSRFSGIKAAIFANPYQKVWGDFNEPPLPYYRTTNRSVYAGSLPGGLIACTGKQTNEIPSLLFSSINEASKAETDLLC